MAERTGRGGLTGNTTASKAGERSFAPMSVEPVTAANVAAKAAPAKARKRPSMREVPAARVDPELVRQLEQEVEQKVTSGRSRMRWFANHLILFVAGVAAAIPLRLMVFTDIEDAFLYLPFGVWVGLLAIHANYAMSPILRRSKAEAQLKALMPAAEKDPNQRELDLR
ncbi:MAG: hypothetical protein HYZ04_00030 [Rhodospirillales bacterium]|nr:hypothetical protein [Rhodospirillales bacterium]MBI3112884.1 hypothetical protein [Rhodospirillales bacterium]